MFAKMFSWGKSNTEREIADLEAQLERLMPVVEPRAEYVTGLKQRLISQTRPVEVQPRPVHKQGPQTSQLVKAAPVILTADVLVAALGVLSGAALLLVGIRAAVTAIAAVGLARQIKAGLQTKEVRPAL